MEDIIVISNCNSDGLLDPPGVRNCHQELPHFQKKDSYWSSDQSGRYLKDKRKNMNVTRTNMLLLFVGREKKSLLYSEGVFKHWEVARSSRRAPPRGAPGSRIPPDQKQAVLQQLAPSQPQGSAGPT
jgi:hypothetical protein